jgi:prephenate dehydrogenase
LSNFIFKKTLIIGLGLIGGSFAKTLRQHKISEKIFALDVDLESLDLAKNDGVIDGGCDNFELLDDDFDFVAIATPLSIYEEIFDEITPHILPETILIDLGSLKKFIEKILPKNLAQNFVACHPIAGSQKTGFENSAAQLFFDKKFIICPNKNNNQNAVKKVENIAQKIGCKVELLDSKQHDEIYALVSHLPQFLSFLTKDFSPKNIIDDFLKTAFRLDDSDPEIWTDIFELNDENLEKFYLEFFDNLEKNIALIKANKIGIVEKTPFEKNFFEANFSAIFFRAVIAKSYLEISAIKNLQNYAGQGFEDFTSIAQILDYSPKILTELVKKNQPKILKLFAQIS